MNTETTFEQTAADSRAAALERDTTGHFWHGQPLQKWNARREILFLALESQALKGGDMIEAIANHLDYLTVLEARIAEMLEKKASESHDLPVSASSMIEWHRFLPAATRVLWLAHHSQADWAHLRADPASWLLQIETWGDSSIADDEIEQAVRLAHLLRTEHRQFITLPRPQKHGGKSDAGN